MRAESSIGSWGRLLRLSLAPTALADVAAGIVLAAGRWPAGREPWLLLLGSACVYHGALVLNDWADRARDRAARPDRPLPSGAIAPGRALALAVAVLAAAYDLAPRGAWSGPLLLGLCRAGNLASGLALPEAALPAPWLVLPILYGLYVFTISRLGRLEDREDRIEERRLHPRWIVLAAALVLPAPAVLAFLTGARAGDSPAWLASLLLGAAGAVGLIARAAGSDWTPGAIQSLMGMALRRLLVFTAAVALLGAAVDVGRGGHGWLVAGAILCGYPVSHALRRAFPPS